MALCVCGNILILTNPNIYGVNKSVYCNTCDTRIANTDVAYHCSDCVEVLYESEIKGYDLCEQCVSNAQYVCHHITEVMEHCDGNNIEQCIHFIQLIALCNQHVRFESLYDSINPVSIINDFLHLIHKHDGDKEFSIIANKLGYCDINKCDAFERNYRYRANITTIRKYRNVGVKQQIMDRIHCYYYHSYDIGHRTNHRSHTTISKKIKTSKFQQFIINEPTVFVDGDHKMFSFGINFKYDDALNKKKHNKIKSLYIKTSKYISLKEEMTQNNIARMSRDQYDHEYSKANIHFESKYRREKYPQTPIEALLCLMIYCNFDHLQYEFSKTYRRIHNDTDERIMNRHQNFYYLGKHLKYVINTKGEEYKHALYHGIGDKRFLPAYSINVVINVPLSTTKSHEVAMIFAENKGLVIEFECLSVWGHRCLSFDVCWLSNYPNEKEHLFVQCDGIFGICNITDAVSGVEYKLILSALKIIENPPREISDEMYYFIQKIIQHQLSHTFCDYESFSFDAYAQMMIHVYCYNKHCLDIYCDNPIFKELRYSFVEFMNIKRIQILFPNIETIIIRNVNLCSLSMDIIYEYLKQSDVKQSNLKLIQFTLKNSDFTMSSVISKYKIQFEAIHFNLEQDRTGNILGDETEQCIYTNFLTIQKQGTKAIYPEGKAVFLAPKFHRNLYFSPRTPRKVAKPALICDSAETFNNAFAAFKK